MNQQATELKKTWKNKLEKVKRTQNSTILGDLNGRKGRRDEKSKKIDEKTFNENGEITVAVCEIN